MADCPRDDDLIAVAWARARAEFGIPAVYPHWLLDTLMTDLTKSRYNDIDELADYCFGVASVVGLLSMHVIGFTGPEAARYAVRLGVAMQLTNILRDIGEDWQRGRLYLPQSELAEFGIDESQTADGRVDDGWREFMKMQINRARELYTNSWPGIFMLHEDGRFAVAAATELYAGILCDIEAHDYDVFTRRAHLSKIRKLLMLPGIWSRLRKKANPRVAEVLLN
jgi:phytoene synthase